MSDQANYWQRRAVTNRLTRRRLLGGAAVAGIGAASLGIVGCGDDDDDNGGSSSPAANGTPGTSGTTAASPSAAGKQKGAPAYSISANNTWDTFDVDRSRFTPISVLFGYTNQGVVQWDNYANGKIG